MSSYQGSDANSPAIGHGSNNQFSHPIAGTSLTAPASPSGAYTASALAYANAQLSQYAATGGSAAIPAHLNPHALSSALSDYSISLPNSAASSPGATPRRLPGTGASTPGGNSRVAASAITGKRLNWSEMICQTIAESESGRLVIQDLFEGMCSKFPEIREWAFGKDWEARVKNRIKSTLSIKGNLFVKVPRPSSAAGKGSWWTLSPEAQEAWKTGRVANVVKNNARSRADSAGPSSIHGSPVRTVSSKFGTSSHTTNPPYLIQGSHAHQNHSQRTSPLGLGLNQTANNYGSPLANNFDFGDSLPLVGATSHGNSALPSNLGLSSDDSSLGLSSQQQQPTPSMQDQAQNAQASMANQNFANLAFLQNNVPQPLGTAQSVPHLGGPQSMPFPAQGQDLSAANLAQFANVSNTDYAALFAGIPGFDANAFASPNNSNNGQVNMGMGAYQMEQNNHPFGGSIPGAYTLLQNQQQQQQQQPQQGQANSNVYGNIGSNMYANLQQGSQQMPGQPQRNLNQNQAQGTPLQQGQSLPSQQQAQSQSQQGQQQQQAQSQQAQQQQQQQQGASSSNNNNGNSGMASSYNGNYPASSPFPPSNGLEGPSPADSTWFSFTPLIQANDSNDGNNSSSALGQLGGEGSRKRRTLEGLRDLTDFQLPPPQSGS
ncbi:uncharacterized protein SPSC_01687 [Sporisorium scitamineum]|uniref:Fork-head domain-containing protein n=1 Tax=Sporisorium scitamineum TaxID=49012 RepID=A0A127ZBQ6_9BASI|nr:uncharacterized protein SPSC_01687 [Sporisorium scitamineum]